MKLGTFLKAIAGLLADENPQVQDAPSINMTISNSGGVNYGGVNKRFLPKDTGVPVENYRPKHSQRQVRKNRRRALANGINPNF